MFTGLIQYTGKVSAVHQNHNSFQLEITTKLVEERIKVGESIAVNGICLTITAVNKGSILADAMPETVSTTTLKGWHIGREVNLERALTLTDRLDGHIVTGHVDTIGVIKTIQIDEIAYRFIIACEKEFLLQIVKKGSIAIDGVSLTVSNRNTDSFEVSIIPHTYHHTTLASLKVGNTVNIETDIIGKYIYQFICGDTNKNNTRLMDVLIKNGFI